MKRKPAPTDRSTSATKMADASRPAAKRTRPPTGGVPDETLKLWVVLARTYAAVAKHVEEDVARHGLTGTEFGILEALYHKGPLLLGEIQRKVLVSSGGITYLVDRLVAKGLVERQHCPNDRRARYAVLTPEGESLMRDVFPQHARRIARALGGLGRAEQVQATELLRALGHAAAADAASSGAESGSAATDAA
jgi:MarR family 2-MHQ and catechol resistance regulon transcriptional repressor